MGDLASIKKKEAFYLNELEQLENDFKHKYKARLDEISQVISIKVKYDLISNENIELKTEIFKLENELKDKIKNESNLQNKIAYLENSVDCLKLEHEKIMVLKFFRGGF